MKKLGIIIVVLLTTFNLLAQDPVVWQDYQMKYKTENVIIVDSSLTQEAICSHINFWLTRVDIKTISSENCVFICKGRYPITVKKCFKKEQGSIGYDVILTIFDTKFKYMHSGFTYNNSALEIIKPKIQKQVLKYLNTHILNDVNSLAQYIKDVNQ